MSKKAMKSFIRALIGVTTPTEWTRTNDFLPVARYRFNDDELTFTVIFDDFYSATEVRNITSYGVKMKGFKL